MPGKRGHAAPRRPADHPCRWAGCLPGVMPPIPNRAALTVIHSTAGISAIEEPVAFAEVEGMGGT